MVTTTLHMNIPYMDDLIYASFDTFANTVSVVQALKGSLITWMVATKSCRSSSLCSVAHSLHMHACAAGQWRITVFQRRESTEDAGAVDAHDHNPKPIFCPKGMDTI